MELFNISSPKNGKVPIIISFPHSGTYIPDSIKNRLDYSLLNMLDDTDWFVDQLYSFAESMGITTIKANYSRWVVDLNRDPVGKPLYNDGRIITGIVPTTNFLGTPLYRNNPPDEKEINQRKIDYFEPYHNRLSDLISDLNSTLGSVLLWDAHSIKRYVPTIQNEPFPDMILGSVDECSAEKQLIDQVLQALSDSPFKVAHNFPFKGGYITRSKGNPKLGINALQLEMSKNLYMDESETIYNPSSAKKVIQTLSKTFDTIINYMAQNKS